MRSLLSRVSAPVIALAIVMALSLGLIGYGLTHRSKEVPLPEAASYEAAPDETKALKESAEIIPGANSGAEDDARQGDGGDPSTSAPGEPGSSDSAERSGTQGVSRGSSGDDADSPRAEGGGASRPSTKADGGEVGSADDDDSGSSPSTSGSTSGGRGRDENASGATESGASSAEGTTSAGGTASSGSSTSPEGTSGTANGASGSTGGSGDAPRAQDGTIISRNREQRELSARVPAAGDPAAGAQGVLTKEKESRSLTGDAITEPLKQACPNMVNGSICLPRFKKVVTYQAVGNFEYQGKTFMAVPSTMSAGWHKDTARLDASKGTSLLAAHIVFKGGIPGPFYNVPNMRSGDTVIVRTMGGKNYTYVVYRQDVVDKTKIPSEVWNTSGRRQIALLTCTGTYVDGHFQQRSIVYAVPVGAR